MTEFPSQEAFNTQGVPSAQEATLSRELERCLAGHARVLSDVAPPVTDGIQPPPRLHSTPTRPASRAGEILELAVQLSVLSGDAKAFERNIAQLKPLLATVG